MAGKETKIGEISRPRFEFRTFGRDFTAAANLMARLSQPVPPQVRDRRSDEIYIMSRANNENNTKIRHGRLDIKTLVSEEHGLEQWRPVMKGAFPLAADVLRSELFPAFQVALPELERDAYTQAEFLEMIAPHPELQAVNVHKHRFGYMVNDTICEVADVLINGAKVVTISSESTEIPDILKTLEMTGLTGVENINYLQAIKRVIGWIDKDLANT